jgi:hypothetical protein
MRWMAAVAGMAREWARALGPYLLLEILLPGGTLIALIVFLVRSSRLRSASTGPGCPQAR